MDNPLRSVFIFTDEFHKIINLIKYVFDGQKLFAGCEIFFYNILLFSKKCAIIKKNAEGIDRKNESDKKTADYI